MPGPSPEKQQGESCPHPEPPPLKWYERLNALNVTFVVFLLAVFYSGWNIQGSGRSINYWQQTVHFIKRFFPPDLSSELLWQTAASLRETVEIALLATFFSIFISFILALGAAQNIAPRWLVVCVRMIMNCIRSIPSLMWAVMAVAIVGANPLAGVVALTFYSIGYLGKFFSEAFESVEIEVARGLKAIGADSLQAFQYGLWPHAKPLIWSHSLWMLEYNIRSAAIIGYVGAGGIGLQLHTYQEYLQWDKFCTVLLCILIVVTLLDFLGEHIRRKIISLSGKSSLNE